MSLRNLALATVVAAGAVGLNASTPAAHAAAAPFVVLTAQSASVPKNTIAIVGDFDNDQIDDVLWYGVGGVADRYWRGKFDRTFVGSSITINGSYEPLTGDFDGDGNLDIFWYAAGKASDAIWYGHGTAGTLGSSSAGAFTAKSFTVNGAFRPLLANFDGDAQNTTDILWYAPGTGSDAFWYGNSDSSRTFASKSVTINGNYDYVTGGVFHFGGHPEYLDLIWWKANTNTHPKWIATGTRGQYSFSSVNGPGTGSLPLVMKINSGPVDDILWYGDGSIPDAVAIGPSFTRTAKTIRGSYAPLWGNFDGDNSNYDDVLWWGVNPGATDALWTGNGTSTFTPVSMTGITHFDYDTHIPLLGYFDNNESLDAIFQDPLPGGVTGFLFGNDVDGANPGMPQTFAARNVSPSARPATNGLRGAVCGAHVVSALRLRCATQR